MFLRRTYYLFILILLFIFSSCSLLFNRKLQKVHIFCDSTIKLNKVEGGKRHPRSERYFQARHKDSMPIFMVPRAKKELVLEFKVNDSLVKYNLKSELSPHYLFGNIVVPEGYFIDLFTPKRYRYPPKNYFSYDQVKQKIVRTSILPMDNDYLKFNIGWSWFNAYHNSLYNTLDGNGSTLGLNLAVDYFVKKNQSLSFETGVATMFVPRTPAPGNEYHRGYDLYNNDSIRQIYSNNSWFILSYKRNFNRISAGVGLDLSPTFIIEKRFYISHKDSIFDNDTLTINDIRETSKNVNLLKAGFAFNIAYNFTSFMSAGMNWHLYITDLNRSNGIYASHFFNFYVTFKLFKINLDKTKRHDYY